MKAKRIFALLFCMAFLFALSTTAYARGHGSRTERQTCSREMWQQRFEMRTLENCKMIGLRQHVEALFRCANYGRRFNWDSFRAENRDNIRHGNRLRNDFCRNR